jgi:hypothetical protein
MAIGLPQSMIIGVVRCLSSHHAGPRLGAYGRYWLVTFAVGKYASVRQVIKETNLFFVLPALLAMFPDSPVAVMRQQSSKAPGRTTHGSTGPPAHSVTEISMPNGP